ncbi:uncharacterized protein [Hyperolius riggenbachi]|uniref:uncharacterized protein n=1 Tax=Hyperolius riggenbachi TaxID=752182 RepID=UPI0035A33A35
MHHSHPKPIPEYADKRYFRTELLESHSSSEAQIIASTSQMRIDKGRTQKNRTFPKESKSIKDQTCFRMEKMPPRLQPSIPPQDICHGNAYKPKSNTWDSNSRLVQGPPPVDRNLKPDMQLYKSKGDPTVHSQSNHERSMPDKERTATMPLNITSPTPSEEEEDIGMASKEVIDIRRIKDFTAKEGEIQDTGHVLVKDNFQKKQHLEGTTSEFIPEWNCLEDGGKEAHVADVRGKRNAVQEGLKRQLKGQNIEKSLSSFEIIMTERYLSTSPDEHQSEIITVEGTNDNQVEVVMKESPWTTTRQTVKTTNTKKMSEYVPKNRKEKEQKENTWVMTEQHAPVIALPATITGTDNHLLEYEPKTNEDHEEEKEDPGTFTRIATVTATQQLSKPKKPYKQEEHQDYETIISLLHDLVNKPESLHPQDEHITFLMSLVPYVKHVPESLQLSMRVSVMNTIISYIPSLSDNSGHTASHSTGRHQRHTAPLPPPPNPAKTL